MTLKLETDKIPERPKKLISYGAFGISVMAHIFLLVMVGGVVLIESTIPRAPFEGSPPVSESEVPTSEEEIPMADEPLPDEMPAGETAGGPAGTAGAAGAVSPVPDVLTTENNLAFSVAPSVSSPVLTALPGTGSGASTSTGGGAGGTGSRPATRLTIFGGDQKTPEAMDAYFYDTKQGKNGKPMTDGPKYDEVVLDFATSGFRPEKLSRYFRSEALYPTRIAIPFTGSAEAVKAFDVAGKAEPTRWIVHYHGKIKAPRTGTYRFAGYGDDFLYAALDGKLILDGCHELLKGNPSRLPKGKYPNSEVINGWMAYGKWVDLVGGQAYDFDVAIGDYGASFGVVLFVQEQGVEYPKDGGGHLILPIFRTDNQNVDRVGKYAANPSGPIFAP